MIAEPRVHPSGERVLEVRDLGIRFDSVVLLSDITFEVVRGEFMCLLGPNGAGKSTLLKCVLGLRQPTSGSVQVLGLTPEQLASGRVGYLPQLKSFDRTFPATAVELIVAARRRRWPVRVRPEERAEALGALARVRGEALADRPLARLSGGETQRVFLARALVTHPELLVLDEPAAGVDARGRDELYELLHEVSRDDYLAAIMVTHSLTAIARTAEKIAFIDGTLRAYGLPREVLRSGELVELMGGHGADHEG